MMIRFGCNNLGKTEDNAGLNYTTHVRDNRKGIIAHTAVSTGVNIPLGVIAERKGDSSYICFKRLMNFLFGSNTGDEYDIADMTDVDIASDRGYMTTKLAFEFLLAGGANIIGTVKRAPCWPFTFDQHLKEHDKRSCIDTKGSHHFFSRLLRLDSQVKQSLHLRLEMDQRV